MSNLPDEATILFRRCRGANFAAAQSGDRLVSGFDEIRHFLFRSMEAGFIFLHNLCVCFAPVDN
jgi:hypothetical protein